MKLRIALLFLHVFLFGFSQEIPPPPVSLDSMYVTSSGVSSDSLLNANPTSNNTVYSKNFEDKFQSKYKGSEFDYKTVKPSESFWEKLQKRIIRFLESFLGTVNPNKTVSYAQNIMWFFAIVIAGLVFYFIIKFFLNKNGNLFFSKRNKKLQINSQNIQENIHEINFPESISGFELEKDYRSAVRYRFLLVLKRLNDQKLISWNPEKTNKDYLKEIKKPQLQKGFKDLIYIFDYVWYGEFAVNEKQYHEFKQKFLDFR